MWINPKFFCAVKVIYKLWWTSDASIFIFTTQLVQIRNYDSLIPIKKYRKLKYQIFYFGSEAPSNKSSNLSNLKLITLTYFGKAET